MIKIPTVFKKDPNNLALVINEVNPGCEWVLAGEGIATRKFDGTAAAVINGELYKRYDVKKGRAVPANAIPCQEPDPITGHWPHWVKVDFESKEDKYFKEAWERDKGEFPDGTYELCGPKINGNKEQLICHVLWRHGWNTLDFKYGNYLCPTKMNFDSLRELLSLESFDTEGIVFYHPDGRMAKIRKSDFGIKR